MDEVIKEALKGYGAKIVGLDDSFEFHCAQCGKCCTNREDILLTPRDLFRAAKELNMTVRDFFSEYCELYIGAESRVPVLRLKPRGTIRRCSLLENRRCRIRGWLLEGGVPLQDEFFYKWHEQLGEMHMKVKAIESMCSSEVMRIIWDLMSILLYFNYEIAEPFDEQFDYNIRHLNKMLDGLLAGEGVDEDERREES